MYLLSSHWICTNCPEQLDKPLEESIAKSASSPNKPGASKGAAIPLKEAGNSGSREKHG